MLFGLITLLGHWALGTGRWPLAFGLSAYPPPSDIHTSTVHDPIFSASFPPKRPESDYLN